MEVVLLASTLLLGLGGLWVGWLYICEHNKNKEHGNG